jgi:hypothetical protein
MEQFAHCWATPVRAGGVLASWVAAPGSGDAYLPATLWLRHRVKAYLAGLHAMPQRPQLLRDIHQLSLYSNIDSQVNLPRLRA